MLPLEIVSKILILRGNHPESVIINELIDKLKFYLCTPISEGGGNFNILPFYKNFKITFKLLIIIYNNNCM